ncbi:Arylsulfatase precursor [Planctomycetes bacterium MalM25]|nr:Arylsulfatase precursor [Planctomycetes bacterium MalM25]
MPRCVRSLGLLVMTIGLAALPADAKPNLVLLFADDAGYGDFGFHGSQHFKTPHLDRLAESGVVLSNFYVSAPVCGPSRAGLITGRYQQRFGFLENNVPRVMSASSKLLGDDMGLPTDLPTMGDRLQGLGYRTAIFGKWHLGNADRYHPTRRGFDEFYGFRGGARSFYPLADPDRGPAENRMERGFGEYREHEGYLTNALADEACDFIERHAERPFFAYVAFNAVHTPMEADPQDADAFPHLKGVRRTAAQMTLSLDRACGQIVAKLEELGLRENTLVVFTNDNGGPSDRNGSSNHPLSGVKDTHREGGVRVPCIVSWPGVLPAGAKGESPMSTLDLLPTFYSAGGGDVSALEGADGVDLMPFLLGKNTGRPHETLYWKKEARAAIRDGDWKLIRYLDRPAELFDLSDDPGEQNDLAATNRDRVKQLYSKLFAWEVGLQRPLFQLELSTEKWSAERLDAYSEPPPASY